MTTLREAATHALEALEDFGMKYYENTGEVLHRDVYESLKAALAEPVLNPAPGYCKHCKQYTIEEPLPAEPMQEPVCDKDPRGCYSVRCQLGRMCKHAATPQRQAEPVGRCEDCGMKYCECGERK